MRGGGGGGLMLSGRRVQASLKGPLPPPSPLVYRLHFYTGQGGSRGTYISNILDKGINKQWGTGSTGPKSVKHLKKKRGIG